MVAIPWDEFTKAELVVILQEFEKCEMGLQDLWSESDVYYAKACDCSPDEFRLPERVLAIKRHAADRMAGRGQRALSPLKRLLQSPFRRYRAS